MAQSFEELCSQLTAEEREVLPDMIVSEYQNSFEKAFSDAMLCYGRSSDEEGFPLSIKRQAAQKILSQREKAKVS